MSALRMNAALAEILLERRSRVGLGSALLEISLVIGRYGLFAVSQGALGAWERADAKLRQLVSTCPLRRRTPSST